MVCKSYGVLFIYGCAFIQLLVNLFALQLSHLYTWCLGLNQYGHADTDTNTDILFTIYIKPKQLPIYLSQIKSNRYRNGSQKSYPTDVDTCKRYILY